MGFSVELAASAVVPKRALPPVKQKKKSSYVIDRNSVLRSPCRHVDQIS